MSRYLATILAALMLIPAAALADGDPASDVLLGQNVFYPYSPPVTASLRKSLEAATVAARQAGFPIKVALIQSPVDLGVIPDLFGKPQKYADFLDQEISFQGKQRLLVVMSTGYGLQGADPKAAAALAGIGKPAGKTSNDLAAAAINAIAKLASAAGHPVKGGPKARGSHGGGSSSTTLVIVLVVAAVLVAAALAVITLRRRHTTA